LFTQFHRGLAVGIALQHLIIHHAFGDGEIRLLSKKRRNEENE
jgi:hypothetical protein